MHGYGPRIIVGVSGSIASLAALRFGIGQARITGGTLHAVLAWCPPGGELAGRGGAPLALVEVWTQRATQRLHAAFDQAVGGIPTDVDACLQVRRGSPGPVLMATADRPSDLLVLGGGVARTSRRPWSGGSAVRRYCIRNAGCPVVLAPPPPMAADSGRIDLRAGRRWLPAGG